MEKLFKVLKDYNTFKIDGKLMLGVTVDEPCYNGNPEIVIPRIYPNQPVFIVDAVLRCCPFIGCRDLKWTQNGNIIKRQGINPSLFKVSLSMYKL